MATGCVSYEESDMLDRSKDLDTDFKSPERENETEEKIRLCLICRKDFQSSWSGERICRSCKSTSAWRSGIA